MFFHYAWEEIPLNEDMYGIISRRNTREEGSLPIKINAIHANIGGTVRPSLRTEGSTIGSAQGAQTKTHPRMQAHARWRASSLVHSLDSVLIVVDKQTAPQRLLLRRRGADGR